MNQRLLFEKHISVEGSDEGRIFIGCVNVRAFGALVDYGRMSLSK